MNRMPMQNTVLPEGDSVHADLKRADVSSKNAAVFTSPRQTASPAANLRQRLLALLGKLPVLMLFLVCTATAFGSFFAKWGFCGALDGPCVFQTILDGTARRPWVYRRLLPDMAAWLTRHLPTGWHDYFVQQLQAGNLAVHYSAAAAAVNQPVDTLLVFYAAYIMAWLAFVAAALLLWRIGTHLTADKVASALAALVFVLVFPMFLTVGGNLYDFSELFFFALAAWIALAGAPAWLLLLAPLATYNKESFFFFVVTLYPLLAARRGYLRAAGWTGAAVVLSGLVYWQVKAHYAGNPGGMVQFHLSEQLDYFRHFGHYGQFEFQYGLLAPRGFNVISLLMAGLLVRSGFKRLPRAMRRQLQLALLINVPLFLLFCYPGELRNLSMLYLGLVAMLACVLSHGLSGFYRSRPPAPSS